MPIWGRSPSVGPEQVLELFDRTSSYPDRLDGALGCAREVSGCRQAYLYLADPAGRLLLERSVSAAPPVVEGPPTDWPGIDEVMVTGGAAAEQGLTPVQELTIDDRRLLDAEVASPVGQLYSLALRTTVDGQIAGVLQVGPLKKHLRRGKQANLRRLRATLTTLCVQARAEHELSQRVTSALAQLDTSERMRTSTMDLDGFLAMMVSLACRATSTDAGFAAIVDPTTDGQTGRLRLRARYGLPDSFTDADLDPDTGMFDWVAAQAGGALLVRDPETAARHGFKAILAVPLLQEAQPLGVIAVAGIEAAGSLSVEALSVLQSFTSQVRMMLHNARLFETFSERYLETVVGLANTIDSRRRSTRGHHEIVSELAAHIARELDLSESTVEAIRIAGSIHDVGMAALGVGESSVAEADTEHPSVGAAMIAHLPMNKEISRAVESHHEWFDGWGFPNGLAGDAIPIGGRVLAVAEFVAEMAAGDVLRPGWDEQRLAVELGRRRGSQFDPQVVTAALGQIAATVAVVRSRVGRTDALPD